MDEYSQAALEARLARAEAQASALSIELRALREAMQTAQPATNTVQAAATVPTLSQDKIVAEAGAPGSVAAGTSTVRPPLPAAATVALPSFAAAAKSPAQRTQSLENKIGSQWFARMGILALLLGVGWALKLAIDNHWIHPSPLGKTIGGLLVGAGVVLWSERFRRKGYAAFSYSLKAVGTGVLYLTLWSAFHLYGLLPAPVALLLMIGVTAWNATMAWLQDAELLAGYALIGAVLTPALLGSGGNHETFLFTYLLAVNVAVLCLLIKKPWPRLLLCCFPATMLYFGNWYSSYWSAEQAGVTALFVVLLSAPFVAVALVGKLRDEPGEGVFMPLGAAAFLSLGLYSVLEVSGRHSWLPWIAVLLACMYLLLQRARRGVVAEAVHLTIAIMLLTVAIPLKASGRWLTVAWLAEGVALLWAAGWIGDKAQQSVRSVLRWLGAAVLAIGTISTAGWPLIDNYAPPAWFNSLFATELVDIVALLAGAWFCRRAQASRRRFSARHFAALCVISANVVLALAMRHEIVRYFESGLLTLDALGSARTTADVCFSGWLMLQSAGLLAIGFWKRSAFVRWQGLVLLVFTIGKVFVYDMRNLSAGYRVLSFMGLGALLMGVSFAYQRDWLSLREEESVTPAPETEAR